MAFRELVGPAVSRRRWTRVAAVVTLLGGLLLGGPFPGGSPAAHAQPAASTSAVDDYGACVAGQKRGDLLLLIDESASLQSTDPQAARVQAAQHMLEKLNEWAANTQVRLDVAIAGFATTYDIRHDWVTLDSRSLPELNGVIDATRDRNHGADTDYALALNQALASFTAHQPDATSTACRAVAWFTDGQLDFTLPPQADQDRINAATQEICRSGGIADQVRNAGIRTFAIGLNGEVPPPDFSLLESIATGKQYQGRSCGDIVTPRPGEFYQANNIDELLQAFAAIAPGPTPFKQDHPVCLGQVQPDCEHKFVLDNSIRVVKVDADGGADGLTPTLIAPDHSTAELAGKQSGTVSVGDAAVNFTWTSSRALTLQMTDSPTAKWRGEWVLAFVDKSRTATAVRSKSSITVYGNLVPAWTERDRILHAEEKTQLLVNITDRDGHIVDPATIEGAATVSVTLIEQQSGARHDLKTLGKNDIGKPAAVDLTGARPGPATLRLTLAVVTAPAGAEPGTALSPELFDIPLTIAPPADFPQIDETLEFGTREGSGTFTAVLHVQGTGCVWLPKDQPAIFRTRPNDVGALNLSGKAAPTDPAGCKPGVAAQSIPITLTVERQSNSDISGVLPVMAARATEINGAIVDDVPFHVHLVKRPVRWALWATLLLAAVLGPGIPLLLLYLMKWSTARIPAQTLKARRFRVGVADGVLRRDGAPFALRDNDFVDSIPELHRSAREIDIEGIELRVKMGWAPTAQGHVMARAPGMLGASSVPPRTDVYGNAVLPLQLHSTWFVLHDPAGPADIATLVLLLPGDAGPAQRSALVADASNTVPGLISELRRRASGDAASVAVEQSEPAPDDPFASRYTSPSVPGGSRSDPFSPGDPGRGDTGADPFSRE
jgi:hypothetical protein